MKKVRPIQGRKLEEVHPLSYSKDLIKVAVDPTSFVGEALLKPEVQLKIAHIFLTLFKFSGKFVAVDRDLLVAESKGETLSETQLMVKQREKSERHIALEKEALNHPLTKALVEEMGAKVINTRVHN